MRLAIHIILLYASLNAFGNTDSLFLAGNQHYQNEAYEQAIESYFAIDSNQHAHALYYNLGNCYYQTGDIPRSILFYEKALLLKKDKQTIENLKIAKHRIQEIEPIPSLFFISWWNSITRFLDTQIWIVFTTVFVWVSCLLFFLFLKNRQKSTFKLFLLAIIFTILLAFISHRSNYLNGKKYAIVMKKTDLLSNISESKGKQIITPGNKIEIIEYKGDFLLITLPNGELGWLNQSEIEEM